HQERQVMELGGSQDCPGNTGVHHDLLGSPLGREVTKHGTVNTTDHRDPISTDNRDIHQMSCLRTRCCPNEVLGLHLITLHAACAMHDDIDSLNRVCNTLTRG